MFTSLRRLDWIGFVWRRHTSFRTYQLPYTNKCLRVALILWTNYSSSITLSRSGGQLKLTNCVISDRRIPLLAGIPLCKSRELSRRGYSMSQLCSIHHDIPVTLHTPGAYGQWSVFDHNYDKQSAVLGTWWLLYGHFEVGWLYCHEIWGVI